MDDTFVRKYGWSSRDDDRSSCTRPRQSAIKRSPSVTVVRTPECRAAIAQSPLLTPQLFIYKPIAALFTAVFTAYVEEMYKRIGLFDRYIGVKLNSGYCTA